VTKSERQFVKHQAWVHKTSLNKQGHLSDNICQMTLKFLKKHISTI
jgi:hypothetical protein